MSAGGVQASRGSLSEEQMQSARLAVAKAERKPLLVAEAARSLFRERLTTIMLVGLCPPAVTCLWLAKDPSVQYWIGSSGLLAMMTWPWILGGHYFAPRRTRYRKLYVLVLTLLPAIGLVAILRGHEHEGLDVYTQLRNEDCSSFPVKLKLQRAWDEARAFLEDCVVNKVELTGADKNQMEMVTPVDTCPRYEQAALRWEKEWRYLQALEERHGCAGWCYTGLPLWRKDSLRRLVDPCSYVVAGVMREEVHRNADSHGMFAVAFMISMGILLAFAELYGCFEEEYVALLPSPP
eukprot:CAMPEP_0178440512 /NCGR_PEP_ID=MMETSP0689_2-20121128/36834_1 /TAXON_ID=160604 /ORGANISM="Amphidinium massartii, Strain CS-259" /LENGTH=292 /DNA_ID=CAMNT_0020063323 /DNA_START=10 /DNA_END=886 /DNA_ORIENTATION=-